MKQINNHTITWPHVTFNLRKVRKERGLSLADVERISHRRWSSAVVGSYERGDRALTIERAIDLADFYRVPLFYLLGIELAQTSPEEKSTSPLTLDLRKVKSAGTEPLQLFVAWLTGTRHDWNGEVMTFRNSDLTTLAMMMTLDIEAVRRLLQTFSISSRIK